MLLWKDIGRMEKEKNRMQIRPDFGKDAGAWRKGRQEGLIASAEGRRAVKRNKWG